MDNAPKASKSEEIISDGLDIGPAITSEDHSEDEIEEFQEVSESKKRRKIMIVAIFVSCVCVIIIIAFLCWFLVDDTTATDKNISIISPYRNKPMYKVCRTQECKAASKYFLNSMNRSANPCKDFYNYVCGGWLKHNKQHFSEDEWTVFKKARSKINNILIDLLVSKQPSASKAVNATKSFFKKCMKGNMTVERRGISKVVKDLGGFPLFKRVPYNRTIRWYTRLATTVRQYGMHENKHGFTLGAILNMKFDLDSNIKIAKPPRTLYDPPSHYRSASYKYFVHDKLCLLLENSCTQTESEKIFKQLDNLTDFQTQLSEYIQVNDTPAEKPEKISIGEIEKWYPELHFYDFLREVFLYSPVLIDKKTEIIVSSLSYLENLAKLIRETEPSVIDNTIGLFILSRLIFYPEGPPILSTYRKNNTDDLRSVWCLKKVQYIFKHAIERLFVDKYFDGSVNNTVVMVVKHMRKAFIKMIMEKKWLEGTPKKMAIKKIQELAVLIGYAHWIMDNLQLDKYYSTKLKNIDGDSMIENLAIMLQQTTSLEFELLSNMITKDPFEKVSVYDVNAYTYYALNAVVVPLGVYFKDLYWPKTVKALKYSGSAYIIAHEMVHSLDSLGVTFNYNGDISNWLVGKSLSSYESKLDCLRNQYGSVIDRLTNWTLKSDKTLDEDIADNGGIRLIYNAYMLSGPQDERLPGLENINDKQLFFVGAVINWCSYYTRKGMSEAITEIHSPDKYRVYLPLSNFDAFAKVFKCPKGNVMNKKNKCVLW